MDKLNPNELDEDEKDLIEYEKLLYFAADFNFESLDEGIENWKPEPEDGENTPAHWIVKKANLLSFFKINGYIESALTLLDDAEERIVTEKYSERLYFYEALRHYKFSATFKRSKKIDFQIKYLESKGLNPTGEIIKSFLEVKDQQKKIEPLGGDRHRYTTSIHLGISPEDDNYLRSFQLAHFLMEAGLPLRIRHTDLINKEREWWRCFKNLFKRYPFVALYYSFHYSDFGQDDKFFRRIGQEIAYSDELQDHLTEMFEGFTGAFNYFLEKQKYIKVDILYFISELFIALPNKTWDPFFEDLWRKFNNTDDLKKEIYPGYPGHGIYSFINKSLPLIENKRLLKEILLELINIKDKGERLKINYLANLTSNPIFESNIRYFQSPDVQKKIAEICQDIISKVEIPLKVLRNISELLSEHDRENILSHLKMFKKLSSLSNDIFPTIIYFSMSDTELHKELKSALIEKSNLWPTGINIEGGKAVNRTIGGSYIFPFHRIRKREDFKQGLEWSEDELSKIYKKLGESLVSCHP